jgi:TP901 family phage tail tape measure protein
MSEILTAIGIKVDPTEAESGNKKVVSSLNKVDQAANKTKNLMAKVFAGFSVFAAVRLFKDAALDFAEFNQGMRNVASVSGATAKELDLLTFTAKKVAEATRFNPVEATQGLYSLASAGQTVQQQIATLPNVLNLAEAAQAELGVTTELVVSSMAQFQISADDSQRVVDVFTASIANSSTNVQRLSVAMRNSGATANAFNQDFESSVSAVSILTTAFGNGEKAGTGYKALLTSLAKNAGDLGVNVADASGKMRPLGAILDDINAKGRPALEVMDTFGDVAGSSLAILLEKGSSGIQEMTDKLLSNGQAANTAAKQLDTLKGDLDQLGSATDLLKIEMGALTESGLRPFIQGLTTLIKTVRTNIPELIASFKALGAAIATVFVIKGLAALFAGVSVAGGVLAVSIRGITVAIAGLVSIGGGVLKFFGGWVGLLASAGVGIATYVLTLGDASEATGTLTERNKELLKSQEALSLATLADNLVETKIKIVDMTLALEKTTEEMKRLHVSEEIIAKQEAITREGIALLVEQRDNLIKKLKETADTNKEVAQATQDAAEAESERVKISEATRDAVDSWVKSAEQQITALNEQRELINGGKEGLIEYQIEQLKGNDLTIEEIALIDSLAVSINTLSDANNVLIKNKKIAADNAKQEVNDRERLNKLYKDFVAKNQPLKQLEIDRNKRQSEYNELIAKGKINSEEHEKATEKLNSEYESISETLENIEFDGIFDGFASGLSPVIGGLQSFKNELGVINELFDEEDWQKSFFSTGLAAEFALNSMASMAEEGSAAQRNLQAAAAITNTILGITAILEQGKGDPYTAFARMASMAALVAGLGVQLAGSFGGGGDSGGSERQQEIQGTGTVLGDAAAKSESIKNALDIIAGASEKIVGINSGMLRSLKTMNNAIAGTATQIAQGGEIGELGTSAGSGLAGALAGIFGGIGLSFLFGSSKVIDRGIQILSGGITEAINGTLVQSFETARRSGLFGSSTRTQTGELEEGINNQIGLIFESMRDAVLAGAEALGVSRSDVQAAIDSFRIAEQQISLKDLSADEQQAELEAVFSSIFDGLVSQSLPFIQQFQQAGEGLGETLARVSTVVLVFEEAIRSMGLEFIAKELDPELFAQTAVAIAEFAGGMETFIEGYTSYVSNFLTDGEQFAIQADRVGGVFDDLSLSLPTTREGFKALIQSLDLTTVSGQEAFGTLIALSSEIDSYFTGIDTLWDSFFDNFHTESERIQAELDVVNGEIIQMVSEIGQDVNFDNFRQLFEEALPTLTPKEIVDWLRLGDNLATANDLAGQFAESGLAGALEEYLGLADDMTESTLSLTEQMANNSFSLHNLIDSYDGSIAGENEIADALSARYSMEIAFIEQIRSASQSIEEMMTSAIDNIRFSQMTDEERYETLRERAEALAATIDEISDPAELEAAIAEINRLQSQAFGLLDEGQQAQLADGFVEFLEEVNTQAQEQLDGIELEIGNDSESIVTRLQTLLLESQAREDVAVAAFGTSVAQMEQAVVAFGAATQRIETINVVVDINGLPFQDVGND